MRALIQTFQSLLCSPLLSVIMAAVFAALLLALFLVLPISPYSPRPNDKLDLLFSVVVGFSSCMFLLIPLGVSSGSPMFDLGYRYWSWFLHARCLKFYGALCSCFPDSQRSPCLDVKRSQCFPCMESWPWVLKDTHLVVLQGPSFSESLVVYMITWKTIFCAYGFYEKVKDQILILFVNLQQKQYSRRNLFFLF